LKLLFDCENLSEARWKHCYKSALNFELETNDTVSQLIVLTTVTISIDKIEKYVEYQDLSIVLSIFKQILLKFLFDMLVARLILR
jgi:hypothetical protein